MRDWRGTEIVAGSIVVYPSRQFSSMWITEGEVVEVKGGKVAVRKNRSSADHKAAPSKQLAYPSPQRLTVIN